MDGRDYKGLNIVFCTNCLDGWTILYKLVTGEVFRHCLKCRIDIPHPAGRLWF